MHVQVEDVGPCKKLVKIEIPAERVDEELERTYDQLNEGVAVSGFRKGHVPRWLIRSKFGKQIDIDTKETLVSESFEEAVKEQELRPIGAPTFDEEIEFAAGKPLTFGVTIEVRPEFEIEDYAGIELKKPSTKPTKAEITQRIDYLRKRYAKLEEISKGTPKVEDVVVGHLVLKEGDDVYREIPDHQFIATDHVLIGMTAEETAEFVTAIKVGETSEKEITVPEKFGDEAKRGVKMMLSFKLDSIRRPNLPEVNEEWVKEVGFDTLDEFNDEIKTAVAREKEQQGQQKLEEQMLEKLLKKVDFELPEDVVKSMARRTLIRQSMRLRQQGVPQEEIEKVLDKMKDKSEKSAQDAAKTYFILDAIAEKERIFVTEDEVDARIEAIAASHGRSADQILRDLDKDDRLSEMRSSMREEKVKAFLLEKAKLQEAKKSASKSKSKKTDE